MLKSEEKIRGKLSRRKKLRMKLLKSLAENEVSEKNIPRRHRKVAQMSMSTGLYSFALSECDPGYSELQHATEWYRDAIREYRTRRDSPKDNFEGETTLLDYLYCALLSGDNELFTEAAGLVRETEPEHYDRFDTQWRYSYTQALAALVLDAGDQREFLDDLERTIPDHDDAHERFFTALWIALAGIDEGDEGQFDDGVEQFLEWHDGQVDFENKTSAEDLVCKQVAALVVLARHRGMAVRVDSEYVPDCVYKVA